MRSNPSLLLSPTLPSVLSDIAVRNCLGGTWWNKARKSAHEKTEGHCHACGTHESKAWYKKKLEGHEIYEIDYDTCTVHLKEVVSLCRSCHLYIHVGRLIRQYHDNAASRNFVGNILKWGIETVLPQDTALKPQTTQAIHYLMMVKRYSSEDARFIVIKKGLLSSKMRVEPRDNWTAIYDGVEYSNKVQDIG